MILACKTIDYALEYSFGFKHLMWVFSGRRGIHCWISDRNARVLKNFKRKAIIEFLNSGYKQCTPFY